MSITTYSELQSALQNWSGRTDLATRIPEFIALFEAQVNRRLRVRQQITSTTLTPSSGSASLPSDFLEVKRVTWGGTPTRQLQYVTPEFLAEKDQNGSSGDPLYFTIEGSTLKIAPRSTTSLDFLYAQKVPALSDSATTNWLLTADPDVYLYGSLSKMATYTDDANGGAVWSTLAEQGLDEMWRLNFNYAGTAAVHPSGPTP